LAQNEAGQQTVVGYDPANQRLYVDRTQSGQRVSDNFLTRDEAPLKAKNGKVALKILVDKCSVEVFANDGEVVLSSLIFPDPASTRLSLFATNGTVKLAHVALRRLDKKATSK
jgi:fructan beta-fructosidase